MCSGVRAATGIWLSYSFVFPPFSSGGIEFQLREVVLAHTYLLHLIFRFPHTLRVLLAHRDRLYLPRF